MIAAEGEWKASKAIRDAGDIIANSPCAIQLRYLQTLNNIAAEKNSTIIFPVPMNIMELLGTSQRKQSNACNNSKNIKDNDVECSVLANKMWKKAHLIF